MHGYLKLVAVFCDAGLFLHDYATLRLLYEEGKGDPRYHEVLQLLVRRGANLYVTNTHEQSPTRGESVRDAISKEDLAMLHDA